MAHYCNNVTEVCTSGAELFEELCAELVDELEELRNGTACDCDESRVANLAAVVLVIFLGGLCTFLAYKLHDATRRDALRLSDIEGLAEDL